MPPEDQPYNKGHAQLAKVKTCLEGHKIVDQSQNLET